MTLNRTSVELLAPAGTWEALTAAVESGADAVYLGGKHFNMRMHEGAFNFDDALLERAIAYTHAHGTKLYVTLNNLISDEELPELKKYLSRLANIRPDALLVQDFAVLELVREMGIGIPLHASVMMNTHNEHAIEMLKEYGVVRIVAGREMTLSELCLLRERTGMELEYFVHGDMCISESGQCIHSGVLFGQSGNRGRCLKPCRWAYRLIDEESGEPLDANGSGSYKLALKDMCLYRHIPELIQSGVFSFKIEGRMRPPEFIRRIVTAYRHAIDSYLADPGGYCPDEDDWKALYDHRVRDFTTAFAFGQATAKDIGFSGKREPRFFSNAVKEAGFQDEILRQAEPIRKGKSLPRLSIRVSTPQAAEAAVLAGADMLYVGGETFLPLHPWRLADYRRIIRFAHAHGACIAILTPRTTMRRECGELKQLFTALPCLGADSILVGNLGSLRLARTYTSLPLQADVSFNLFNHLAAKFLRENGCTLGTASLELSFGQLKSLVERSELPIEAIVHGSCAAMLCDHDLPGASLPPSAAPKHPAVPAHHYALLDTAGEAHPIRIDQYGRNHIYFAKDLCLYPYLDKFSGVASCRIEAQDYTPSLVALVTKTYREALNRLAAGQAAFCPSRLQELQRHSPRPLGIGTYRFRQSRDSL